MFASPLFFRGRGDLLVQDCAVPRDQGLVLVSPPEIDSSLVLLTMTLLIGLEISGGQTGSAMEGAWANNSLRDCCIGITSF